MGMFDTLATEEYDAQVKIFYHPVYDQNLRQTWHSGGSMECFKVGEVVPTRTEYYCYPNDFYIVLYDYEDYDLAVIEDGKFAGFIQDYHKIERMYPVLDYLGNLLNINTVTDFIVHESSNADTYRDYAEKWIIKPPLWHTLGELFACWKNTIPFGDEVHTYGDYKIDFKVKREKIEEDIRNFIEENPFVYSLYLQMQNLPYLIREGL